jgi:hypothetical protein
VIGVRIEYNFNLDRVDVPCFSVEAEEGPQKIFTLTTVILNVLAERPRADVIFHSPNPGDLPKKVTQFKKILASAPAAPNFDFKQGESGSLGSSYYLWLSIHATGGGAKG